MLSKIRRIRLVDILPVLSVGCVLLFWIMVAKSNDSLAGPIDTYNRLVELTKHSLMGTPLWGHVWASLRRILISFVLASIVGVSLGVAFGVLPTFRRIMWPVFSIIRPIPPLAWIPIVVLWCGVAGDTSKEVIIFIGIVMAIVINTFEGIKSTDELLLKAASSLGANRWQMLFDVTIPNSIPVIFAGMKAGLSTGWMSLVAAEMIAAKEGLGFLINMSMKTVPDTALDLVGIILIAISSAGLTILLNVIERRLCPWLHLK